MAQVRGPAMTPLRSNPGVGASSPVAELGGSALDAWTGVRAARAEKAERDRDYNLQLRRLELQEEQNRIGEETARLDQELRRKGIQVQEAEIDRLRDKQAFEKQVHDFEVDKYERERTADIARQVDEYLDEQNAAETLALLAGNEITQEEAVMLGYRSGEGAGEIVAKAVKDLLSIAETGAQISLHKSRAGLADTQATAAADRNVREEKQATLNRAHKRQEIDTENLEQQKLSTEIGHEQRMNPIRENRARVGLATDKVGLSQAEQDLGQDAEMHRLDVLGKKTDIQDTQAGIVGKKQEYRHEMAAEGRREELHDQELAQAKLNTRKLLTDVQTAIWEREDQESSLQWGAAARRARELSDAWGRGDYNNDVQGLLTEFAQLQFLGGDKERITALIDLKKAYVDAVDEDLARTKWFLAGTGGMPGLMNVSPALRPLYFAEQLAAVKPNRKDAVWQMFERSFGVTKEVREDAINWLRDLAEGPGPYNIHFHDVWRSWANENLQPDALNRMVFEVDTGIAIIEKRKEANPDAYTERTTETRKYKDGELTDLERIRQRVGGADLPDDDEPTEPDKKDFDQVLDEWIGP